MHNKNFLGKKKPNQTTKKNPTKTKTKTKQKPEEGFLWSFEPDPLCS